MHAATEHPSIVEQWAQWDGRWTLFGLLAVFWTVFGLLYAVRGDAATNLCGVPSMGLPFADLRVILAGMESQRAGFDPLLQNPNDPWPDPDDPRFGRRMNYPRVWLWPGVFGLTQEHTAVLGLTLAVLFYGSLFAWVGRLTHAQALLYAAALLSAPHLMAIFRGNNDLVVFILLALAAFLVRCRPALRPAFYVSCFFLSILKYYPILGLSTLGRERSRPGIVAGIVAALLFVGLLALNFREVQQVSAATPRPQRNAYGSIVGSELLQKELREQLHLEVSNQTLAIVALTACGLVLVFAAVRSGSLRRAVAGAERADDFLLGAGIFLGSFLFGANWNYRLIYLLFLFPQVLRWSAIRGPVGRHARRLLAAILVGLWAEFPLRLVNWDLGVVAEAVALWVVFGLTATFTFALWRVPGGKLVAATNPVVPLGIGRQLDT